MECRNVNREGKEVACRILTCSVSTRETLESSFSWRMEDFCHANWLCPVGMGEETEGRRA